jgi:hypothetical protein
MRVVHDQKERVFLWGFSPFNRPFGHIIEGKGDLFGKNENQLLSKEVIDIRYYFGG